MVKVYRFVKRPANTEHGHSFLVYDCTGKLDIALTRFAKLATVSLNERTIEVYLYALLPYFTWLNTDFYQVSNNRHWQSEPRAVRQSVEDYLNQELNCQIQSAYLGYQLIRLTARTHSQVKIFLVSLKCFYKLMNLRGYYQYPNPLIDNQLEIISRVESYLEDDLQYPRMPYISGVESPNSRQRLTDSYYKLVGSEWKPQIIDDATLPNQIISCGRQLKQWNLRAEIITRKLFETGGRISEIVGLTLGDWVKRGMRQEADTFSKGSGGIRVKFIRFSSDTAKLLRRYFNEERCQYDPNKYTLDNYCQLDNQGEIDLYKVPLYLTKRRTQLTPDHYRDNYWKPACQKALINVDVHQARHWYVTMALRQIFETSKNSAEIEKRKRELKEYMKWRSEETIKAYDHYFDSLKHAEIQDFLHARMDSELKQYLNEQQMGQSSILSTELQQKITEELPSDDEFNYLMSIGGKSVDE
ncbi:MAG: site-specific integrase [Gloeotrichia echinulata DEX184]|nr:site-specific integrase [Gloeotrichia echinulata DEX184]